MEESTEEDHHGVQQDIQQIHKVLGENEDLEELEESDDNEEDNGDRKEDGAYLGAGTSSSGPVLSQLLSDRPQDSRPVPESLSLARSLEPSAENLLQINLSYQDMVCTLLDNIKAARKKNFTIQKNVASKTTTYVKGARPISHFQKHYFSGHASNMPPLSDEAREIKSKNIPTPFTQPAKSWTADEDRALYEGVRNDGLQRCMKPLMARQEILYHKRRSALDEEKQQLTREINDITTRLEHLKAPEEELLGDRMRDTDWLKISSLHLNGERSEIECQLRWQNILHPSINKKDWSKQEEFRLNQILENARGRDWTDVINELGTNRSPFDCFSNFQNREISQYVSRPFSQEEDEVIVELSERFKVGNHIQFNKVAYFMDQRLARQISRRWYKKLDPKSKWGFWTKEEDEALMAGIELYGYKWSRLRQFVKGRSSSQIRDRWMYTLNPNNKKGIYAFKEDIGILQCVKEFGVGNWVVTAKKLAEITGNTRTPNSVLHRFNTLFHRFFKKVKGINLQESASMEVLNSIPLDTILDEMIEYRQSLGEENTGTREYKTDLYNRKKRKPRTPPRPLMAKNASYITRQNVLSELDQQLMDAIKPIGWALPVPGTWREFYGSKAVRRQRRHYIFSVLLKALDISIVGNEGLLASMVTNHEGIKVLKEGQLLPKATVTTTQDDEDKSVMNKAKSSKSEMKPKKCEVKSSQSEAKSSEKVKTATKSSDRMKGAGSSTQDCPEGQSSQSTVTLSQGNVPMSRANVTVSQGNVTLSQGNLMGSQSNVTTSQGIVTMSQGNVPMSQGIFTMSQGKVPMSQANVIGLPSNITMSQASVPIPKTCVPNPEPPIQRRVAFAPPGRTVKSEFLVRRPHNSVFGEGTLQVGDGYLVPVQNYVSRFGDTVPQKKLVTLMRPRVGGGIQTTMQFGGIPVTNHHPYSITAPLPGGFPLSVAPVPLRSATTGPQMMGVPAAMAPLPMHPTTNMLQPMGSPIAAAPVLPSIGTIPKPQHSGIIHVPGKGYLVPLNRIKQEPGTFPAPPLPTRKTNIAIPSIPTNVFAGQAAGVSSDFSNRYPAPGSANPVTLTPNSSAASQPAIHEAVNVTVEDDNNGNITVLSAATSSQSSSSEQQESGTLQENGQSSLRADLIEQCDIGDKDVESPDYGTSDPSSSIDDIKKFDPVLPVLPPNEASIAGLMALLLQRKRLEVNAGKRESIRKFKSWSCESNDKGILRGHEGLLQELSANNTVQRLPQETESEIVADKPTHCEPVQLSSNKVLQSLPHDAEKETQFEPVQGNLASFTDTEAVHTNANHTDTWAEVAADTKDTGEGKWEKFTPVPIDKLMKQRQEKRKQHRAEVAADNSAPGEGKWERRTPVPVGAWKTQKQKQRKKNGYWTLVRSSTAHVEALNSIRKSTWYEKLQPRFLSMFLWPAMLSIVGPHRKKVLLQKKVKKTNLARQTGNQPRGSKLMNPTDDADKAGNTQKVAPNRGRKRKNKTPPKRTEGSHKRKPSVKKKDTMKKIDGVARRTRSASHKKNGTTTNDRDQKNSAPNYVEIPSDADEFIVPDADRADRDGKEIHLQAFMAFGHPAVQEGTQAGTEAVQSGTKVQSLHQAQEDVSTLSVSSTVQVHNPSQKPSSESASFSVKRPEAVQRTPTTSGSQSTKSPAGLPNSKKRLLEEADVTEASPKRTKQV